MRNETNMYICQNQCTPKDTSRNWSYKEHQPFIDEQAHEEIQCEVDQQVELITQPNQKIEDQTWTDGEEK